MQNKRCIYKQRYIKARHVQTQTSLYVRMSRLKWRRWFLGNYGREFHLFM